MKVDFFFWQLIVFLMVVSLNGTCQNNSIRITSEINSDQSIDFFFDKDEYGSFYLNLTFDQLENAARTSYKGKVQDMHGKLLSIKPLNPNKSIGFSYKYVWIRGVLNPRIDTSFVYLLPVSKGETIRAVENTNLYSEYFGNTKPKNWKSFQFNVNPGDTVFSARKGLVVELKDGMEPDSTVLHSYSSKSNSILIEHEDGTLACYSVLKNGSFMVKPGQIVFPHTPLALAGTFDMESKTQIKIGVYYLSEENIEEPDKSTLKSVKNYYAFVNPLFHTSEGDVYLKSMQKYTADYTPEHILKDLTKREKKKFETQKISVNK